jgi:hypothetical protein
MSQYKTGTATVTNGSATVTGSGTLWSANVSAADSFTIAGDGVMYDVASVDSDTQVTLSVAYAGSTASGAVYTIARDFTSPDDFPELTTGDIETPTIITRALRKIQSKFSSILAGGANANFTAMPQVGGDPIVESGSNADGQWTRWADGTLIMKTVITSGTYGSGVDKGGLFFSSTLDFDFPTSNVGVMSGSVATGNSALGYIAIGAAIDSGVWRVQLIRGSSFGSGGMDSNVELSAIGLWK